MFLKKVKMDKAIPAEARVDITGQPGGPTSEEPSGGASGTGIPLDEEVDDEEAAMFGDIDDELFNSSDDEDYEEKDETPAPVAEVPKEEEVPQPEPEPAAAEEPKAEEPTPQEAPPPQAAEAPLPPQQQEPQPVQETPPAAQPETPAQSYAEMRQNAQAELEKRYALSPEDADAMISEPEKVLPKIASQLYLDVYENVLRDVQQFLPNAVQHITQTSQRQQQDEADFFGQWPSLASHRNEVARIGTVYRQLNPQATKEQFIQDVGLQASIQLRLPVEGQPVAQPQVAPAPQTVPPVPARGGPASTPPSPRGPQNQFEGLAAEWENEAW